MATKVLYIKQQICLKFGPTECDAILSIVRPESGLNQYAINFSSGACGLGQFLPCSKLLSPCGSLNNLECQIIELKKYISNRYGDANTAWNFWQTHHYY